MYEGVVNIRQPRDVLYVNSKLVHMVHRKQRAGEVVAQDTVRREGEVVSGRKDKFASSV